MESVSYNHQYPESLTGKETESSTVNGIIRLLIVDDHVLVREGIRSILNSQPDIEIVGEAANGEEAVEKADELRPDVILMDIAMPVMNGLKATEIIKKKYPDINILTLTIHEDDRYFFKILEAGASGYFLKGGSSAELISALHTVREGQVFLYPTMASMLVGNYLKHSKKENDNSYLSSLTKREKEVLELIAQDFTNREIASRLFLSPATVQTHRANIMAKLNLHSRTELTKYAISCGLISLDR